MWGPEVAEGGGGVVCPRGGGGRGGLGEGKKKDAIHPNVVVVVRAGMASVLPPLSLLLEPADLLEATAARPAAASWASRSPLLVGPLLRDRELAPPLPRRLKRPPTKGCGA